MTGVAQRMAAAQKAVADAMMNRDLIAERIAALPAEVTKLQRAEKFTSVFKTKAEFDARTAAQAKAVAVADGASWRLKRRSWKPASSPEVGAARSRRQDQVGAGDKLKPAYEAAASDVRDLKSQIAAKESDAQRAERRAARAKQNLAKNANDKNAKDIIEKTPALVKTANDAAAAIEKGLAPKEAALAKVQAEYAPLAKTAGERRRRSTEPRRSAMRCRRAAEVGAAGEGLRRRRRQGQASPRIREGAVRAGRQRAREGERELSAAGGSDPRRMQRTPLGGGWHVRVHVRASFLFSFSWQTSRSARAATWIFGLVGAGVVVLLLEFYLPTAILFLVLIGLVVARFAAGAPRDGGRPSRRHCWSASGWRAGKCSATWANWQRSAPSIHSSHWKAAYPADGEQSWRR